MEYLSIILLSLESQEFGKYATLTMFALGACEMNPANIKKHNFLDDRCTAAGVPQGQPLTSLKEL